MAFGMEGAPEMHWSKVNYGIALDRLKEKPPTFGEDGDTGEKEGEYFAMGIPLEKNEYDLFMGKLAEFLEYSTEELNKKINMAPVRLYKKEEDENKDFKKAA